MESGMESGRESGRESGKESDIMTRKKCIRCGKIRKCRVNTHNNGGYQRICASCNREQYKEYYEDNKDYKCEYQRLYRLNPKEAHKFAVHKKLYNMVYKRLVKDGCVNKTPEQKLKLIFGEK